MAHPNEYKFLHPPTNEQIDAVLKSLRISGTRFERYHSIYFGAIRQHKMGYRTLPVKHWHLFLEPQQVIQKSVSIRASKLPKTETLKRTKTKPTGTLSNLLS